MNILFVVNTAYVNGNGLSASCRRTVKYLRELGETVKVLSASAKNEDEHPDFVLPTYKMPVFQPLITKQGYSFAKSDKDVIRKAVRWADVVHLEEPFILQVVVAKIATEEGKVITGTYHLHPENLYSSVHLQKSKLLNGTTMRVWRDMVFYHCKILQCPTENVRERLESWHFKSELRVISNGMIPFEDEREPIDIVKPEGAYLVVSTGRLSVEKDQYTLIRAVKRSAFADRILLVLAGRGPEHDKMQAQVNDLYHSGVLKIKPVVGFFSLGQLRSLYDIADLYVHCATVEVEGLSCMEAVQQGVVPIIAKGPLTATSQFALSEKSTFPVGDDIALANAIDYWLSDDGLRRSEAEKYKGTSKAYDVKTCVSALRKMLYDAYEMRDK